MLASWQGILHGLGIALLPANLALYPRRRVHRHHDQPPAGDRSVGRHRAADAGHLRNGPDHRPDDAGRHLLRLHVWRRRHRDPDQHAGRRRGGHDGARRLSAGAQGPRRRGARDRGRELFHRRHARRHRAHLRRHAARRVRAEIRAGRIFRPDAVRADDRERADRRFPRQGADLGLPRPCDLHHRHRPAERPAALHHGRAGTAAGREFLVVVVGMFALAEVGRMVEDTLRGTLQIVRVQGRIWFTREEWRRAFPAILRGAGVGFFCGAAPGLGGTISAMLAYVTEKRVSRHPRAIRQGRDRGRRRARRRPSMPTPAAPSSICSRSASRPRARPP